MEQVTLWAIVVGYLLVMVILGEVCARYKIKGLDDYLVASRKHGVLITAGTLVATVIGAGSTIGASGVAFYVGISASWYLLSACVGLVLLAFTFAPLARRMSLYTIPQFIENRYGIVAGAIAIGLGIIGLIMFLSAQIYAMGILTFQLTMLPISLTIILSGLVVVFYTWRGGNWAVHWSDNIQMWCIIVGMVSVSLVGIKLVGGLANFPTPPTAKGFETVGAQWFNPLTKQSCTPWDIFALGNVVVGWIIMSVTWHFTMQSTAQRVMSSRDSSTAKYACLIAAGVIVPLGLVVALSGMTARVLYPSLPPPSDIAQAEAFPALVKGILNPVLGGVVLAALIAVVMSTCDSALLGASTIMVKDVYQRWLNPRAGDHTLLRISRQLTLIIGLAAIGTALLIPALIKILEMVATVYCIALFVPIILGLYWKSANSKGAIAAMAVSAGTGLAWRIGGFEKDTGVHMLNISLPLSFITMVLFSVLIKESRGEMK
jgi:SSS family solute:Na+ symporter